MAARSSHRGDFRSQVVFRTGLARAKSVRVRVKR